LIPFEVAHYMISWCRVFNPNYSVATKIKYYVGAVTLLQ
jgi:hypothetical protein